jgi:hypothetical protein
LEFILKVPEFKFVLFISFHILFWLSNNFSALFLFFLNFWSYSRFICNFQSERVKFKSGKTKIPLVPLVSPPVVELDWAGPNRSSRSVHSLSHSLDPNPNLSRFTGDRVAAAVASVPRPAHVVSGRAVGCNRCVRRRHMFLSA